MSHPFWMYDMIREIPSGFKLALSRATGVQLPTRSRMLFTGNGTAFFSAWTASQVLRDLGTPYEVVQGFELEHYLRPSREHLVIGISHSGITKATLDPLRKAKESGAFVVGITHFEGRPIQQACDITAVVGNGPDRSRCHTKANVVSAGAAAMLGLKGAAHLGADTSQMERKLENDGGPLEKVTMESEPWAKVVVDESFIPKQVVFAGAGPNLVTSREAALKVKESSYLPSEGIEIEEEMHGPWVALDSESVLVVIAPKEHLAYRAQALLKAARNLKTRTITIGGRGLGADREFNLPEVDEILSPYLAIVPLYFFAYFLSVKLGHNPDYLRYLEPAYWNARGDIFPPGTH